MRHISRLEGLTKHVVFMDDRSWISPCLNSFLHVFHLWQQHSMKPGFGENDSKSQFTHRNRFQRAHMQEYAELKHGVSDSLLALGAVVGTSSITPKELSRLEKARACAAKVKLAPIAAGRKAFVGLIAAGAKATYGWLARTPPAAGMVSKLETALRRVGYCHRMASPALIRLIMGHPVDVLFQPGAAVITAILRTVRRTQ